MWKLIISLLFLTAAKVVMAANPFVSVSLTTMPAGPVYINQTYTVTLTLINISTTDELSLNSLAHEQFPAGFSAVTNCNNTKLAVGGSCTITGQFNSAQAGNFTWSFKLNAFNRPWPETTYSASLAVSNDLPSISAKWINDLPATAVIGNINQIVTIAYTNTSAYPAYQFIPTVTKNAEADFSNQTSDNCDSTLASQTTCKISFNFNPTTPGLKSAIASASFAGGSVSPVASTTSYVTGVPTISAVWSPDLPSQSHVGKTKQLVTVTFTNNTEWPAYFFNPIVNVNQAADFTVTNNTCENLSNETLPVNGSCSISYQFAPLTVGDKYATASASFIGGTVPETTSTHSNAQVVYTVNAYVEPQGCTNCLGTIAPNAPQTVAAGQQVTFQINPAPGATISSFAGTCGGTLNGTQYTTATINADCAQGFLFTQAYSVPTPNSQPSQIVAGADGNMWFLEQSANKIAKITPAGVITEYTIPHINSYLYGITQGPDGNIWFTEQTQQQIGKITPNGVITEYPLPTNLSPLAITTGADGNLWFIAVGITQHLIIKMTPVGNFTEYPISGTNQLGGITAGQDGNIWFADLSQNAIGKITPNGVITEYPISTPNSFPFSITAGMDGNIWFTELGNSNIGKITPNGVITEYPLGAAFIPFSITASSDGNIWFTVLNNNLANTLGKITPNGVVSLYLTNSETDFIAAGPNSTLWFTGQNSNQITRF